MPDRRLKTAPAFAFALLAGLAAPLALAPLSAVPAQAAPGKGPDTVADAAERVMDAVVNISTSQNVASARTPQIPQLPPGSPYEEFFEEFFKRRQGQGDGDTDRRPPRRVSSLGSGFVIDPAGLIVTNNHVISDADEIFAVFNDGTRLKAELVGRDPKTDIALLRVKPDKPLKAVRFGDSDKLRVGDWVMAIGNPFGLGGTLTVGVVSARNRDINSGPYDNFIQTDAAINRGNSGGPLFNMDGEVVGINTAIISPTGGSIGIGFAVPSASAKPVLAQLEEFKEVRRGWIGARIQPVTEELAEALGIGAARGALVGVVTEDSPAAKAGLKAGDVIVTFNGRDIKTVRDLTRTVADTMVGAEVDVVVLRDGKPETLRFTVARMPDDLKAAEAGKTEAPAAKAEAKRALGMSFSAITEELRRRYKLKTEIKGAVITEVDRGSPAAEKGLRAGQVIVQVGQEAVAGPAEVEAQIEALRKQNKKSALFLISDGEGQQQFVTVPLN